MRTVIIIISIIIVLALVYYFIFYKKPAANTTNIKITPLPGSVQSPAFIQATKEATDIINNSPVFTDAKKVTIQSFMPGISTTKNQETNIVAQALKENVSITIAILKVLLSRLDNVTGVPSGTNYALLVSSGRL